MRSKRPVFHRSPAGADVTTGSPSFFPIVGLGEYFPAMNESLSKAASKMDRETELMSQEGKSIQPFLGIGPFLFIVRWFPKPKKKGDSSVAYFLHGD